MTAGPMTGPELAEALARLGYSHAAFARHLSAFSRRPVNRTTVSRWCHAGEKAYTNDPPAAVVAHVRDRLALQALGVEI